MTTTLARLRPTGRQDQLRRQLVELVLAEGFAHLTVDDYAARLRCSKRTLYTLATSKEQLATLSVREFFRAATSQVEAALARLRTPATRLTGYLDAIAAALQPASVEFLTDVTDFGPTRELYQVNTDRAAARVAELINDGVRAKAFRTVSAAFVGDLVASTMRRILSGEVSRATGLTDAQCYAELSTLVMTALRRKR
ncbi:MAG: TetR/AcrR family transcriptional regulator [Propionibacteriales bacterium]|nr:TetR/AcrR family transcriptional regulator [Propionibacteriales bacterium]